MTENWKPVPGYEGIYEVSDQGRVRSLARFDNRGRRVPARMLACPPNAHGYPEVNLNREGKGRVRLVHTLVLEAFIGPRPDGYDGCHGDGNPANNHVSNLRWDTHHANMLDASAHGTVGGPRTEICQRGHVKDGRNSRGLFCRTCQREAGRRYKARKAVESAIDLWRTSRADERAADRASAQGYGGGA